MIEKEFMPSGEEGLIKFFDTVEELVKELK
jgi:hypothetical protein